MKKLSFFDAEARNPLQIIIFCQVVSALISLALVLAISSYLGIENYGKYAWIVSTSALVSLFFQLGIPTTILKTYAPIDLAGASNEHPLGQVYSIFFLMAGLSTLVAFFLVASFGCPETALILPISLSNASSLIGSSILRAGKRPVRAQLSEQLGRLLFFVAILLLMSFFDILNIISILFAYCSSYLAASYTVLHRITSIRGLTRLLHSLFRVSVTHAVLSVLRNLSNHIPIFVSGLTLSPTDVGYLALALQVTAPANFGLVASRHYYAPHGNRALRANERKDFLSIFLKAWAFSSVISTIFLISVIIIAYVGHSVFFKMFPIADPEMFLIIILITSAYRFFHSGFGPNYLFSIFLGLEHVLIFVSAIFSAIFLSVTFFAAAWGDIIDVATTALAYSLLTNLVISSILARRYLKYDW